MTKLQRLNKLRRRIYDKTKCPKCHGTGRIHNGKYGGCAKCFVSSSVVMVSPKEFRWLIEQAERSC